MRVSVRRVRFVVALIMALMLVSSLSIVLSGTASATTGQQRDSDHQGEGCTELDLQGAGSDPEECKPDDCDDLAAQSFGGEDSKDCEPSEECPELTSQSRGDESKDCEPDDCDDLAVQSFGGVDHGDCEPAEECPDLAVQSFGGGDHEDCDSEECPELTTQSRGDESKDCEPSEECPELAVQTGGDHGDDEDCDSEECPELAVQTGGDSGADADCDSEECPELAVQTGGDHGDDDVCKVTTTTTTVPTVAPTTIPEELDLAAVGAECFNDIPYLKYAIDYPAGQSATITFLNPTGADIVYEDVPLSGAVLWPGASETPPDWPGWILQDGVWVAADDGFLWARGDIEVLFEVNPSTVLTVSYPQSSEACADPENIPDEVEGTVVTPPTTPDQVDGVDVLPFTGVHGGALAAVAFGVLALGCLMLISARRDEAEEC
ncbi:MAG: hypothetical protein K0T01_2294 [Acidimicrobiia bacterium]|nr:hypothetical protein [Acidimicrobiia bacterium]